MAEFDAICGVDFSASARDAGRNTWIAECTPTEAGELHVDCLADAAGFLDCDPDRETTLAALVDEIADRPGDTRAFGLDVPFGLPADLLGDVPTWRAFISGVRDRGDWGAIGTVDGPLSLYEESKALAQEVDVDLLRETDRIHGGQEPTGFRIKTQTYYGISAVLAELEEDVAVVPMDDVGTGTVVLETYPAAAFRRLGEAVDGDVFDTGYKRDTRESVSRRRANVRALDEAGVAFGDHREFAVAADHALDAVAAAYATWRAACADGPLADVPESARREGHIYA